MRAALALFLGICISAGAFAQEPWPSRPIRFILPFPPGGGTDILGRVIADRLAARRGGPAEIAKWGDVIRKAGLKAD